MGYRRGFKSEANSIARDTREELGLAALDPLDPWALANHLGVPVIPLWDFRDDAAFAVRYLREVDIEVFSAVTVFNGSRRTIVHNDAHKPGRRNSNVTHELGHALLHHEPHSVLDDRGCRLWDQNIEDEAQWLAGALLVTEDAALWIARSETPIADGAARFGVSESMINYRLNVTGARKRVARAGHLRVVR